MSRNLFYSGKVNALFGDSGDGKSWVAFAAARECIKAGRHVVCVDLEDHASSVVNRLLAIGCTADELRAHFAYISPDEPYGAAAAERLERLITEQGSALVIVDSTGEALALNSVKDEDVEITKWFRAFPRRLAALGPAVLITDHVPKARDAPKLYSIGSQRKRAAIDGVTFRVDGNPPPARGQVGYIDLTCAKDRNGTFQRGAAVARIIMKANEAGTKVELTVGPPVKQPNESGDRLVPVMRKISHLLAREGRAMNLSQFRRQGMGNTNLHRAAVDRLVDEGFVRELDGFYSSIRPLPDGYDDLNTLTGGNDD